jgi:hypothetical protein
VCFTRISIHPFRLHASCHSEKFCFCEGDNKMGLFGRKEEPKELSAPATIILTCNAIPSHAKATYWFDVSINGKAAGRIEQNGSPLTFTTTVDKNELLLELGMKQNNGDTTVFHGRKQKLELKDGETVKVLFENRRFTIS